MTKGKARHWGNTLKLFLASSALLGCQEQSSAPVSLSGISVEPTALHAGFASFTTNFPDAEIVPVPAPAATSAAGPDEITEPLVLADLPLANPPLADPPVIASDLLAGTYRQCDKEKYAAIVTDAVTGDILYGYNMDTPRHPASLTKVMTMFLAFEEIEQGRLKPGDRLHVARMDPRQGLSMLKVKPHDIFTVEDALKGIVTRSAADATDILAENISGSVDAFVERMNTRAKSLGMHDTHFTNPSGAPDPNQISTARDMATLMRAIMQYFPEQCAVFQTKTFHFRDIAIRNRALLPGSDMGKTGLTDASGSNIILSYPGQDHRLIVGVFGGKSSALRNAHAQQLFAKGKTLLPETDSLSRPASHGTDHFRLLPLKQDIAQLDAPEAPVQPPFFAQYGITMTSSQTIPVKISPSILLFR